MGAGAGVTAALFERSNTTLRTNLGARRRRSTLRAPARAKQLSRIPRQRSRKYVEVSRPWEDQITIIQ